MKMYKTMISTIKMAPSIPKEYALTSIINDEENTILSSNTGNNITIIKDPPCIYNQIWKKEMPYDVEDLDFEKPVYCFDGYSIKLGHFDSKNGVPLFISSFVGEQYDCDLWCYVDDLHDDLFKISKEIEMQSKK